MVQGFGSINSRSFKLTSLTGKLFDYNFLPFFLSLRATGFAFKSLSLDTYRFFVSPSIIPRFVYWYGPSSQLPSPFLSSSSFHLQLYLLSLSPSNFFLL